MMMDILKSFAKRATWEKVYYLLRFKSPAAGKEKLQSDDLAAIILVLLIVFLFGFTAIFLSLKIAF